MANWTKDQKAAIDARNKNTIVAAAAGSGKTAVLVERIIGIVTDEKLGVDVDNLLVVTFTNAAAAEMKERISAAISRKLEENPDSEHLQKQLALLNRANIMTLHAFCTKLIKSAYVKLNIDASVRIADESECKILKAETMDELLEEMFEKEDDDEFIAFAESVKDETNFENLKKVVLETYEVIQSLPFPYFWLKEAAENYNIGNKNIEDTFFGKIFVSSCVSELESVCNKIKNAIMFVPTEYRANFADDFKQIRHVLRSIRKKNFDEALEHVNNIEFSRLGRREKGTSEVWAKDSKNLRDEVKEDIKKIADKYFFRTFDEMAEDICLCAPQLMGLYKCVKRFNEIYSELKKEKTVVDFNDLEHLAIKVLYDFDDEKGTYNISQEAFELQKNFYEIMTDEYQDSNSVQEMILNALAGRGKNEANRFMVGDVKQSIYRFRQADPEIFLGKINNLAEDKNSEIIYFSKNFRSRKNVLDSVNYVFKRVITKENGGLEYNDNEALYYGAYFPESPLDNDEYNTELNIINLSSEPLIDDDAEDFSNAQKELTFVASRINDLIGKGFVVLDKKSGQYRKIRYSDIVVLLRSAKTWAPVAEEIFEKFSIPVFTGSDGGYFEKKEISVIVSLLKAIDNSYQDIPVISVLKSYIYGVSDNELAEIKIHCQKDCFIENIREYALTGENEETKKKLANFIADIENWKKISPFISVRELLWRIYTETGYYDYTGALPMGNIKQANLNLLLEKAETVAQTGVKSLFDFINYIEKIEKNAIETGEAKVLNENENVVRIMTIHKSKGLEFPVVFVSGLGRKFNFTDTYENYIIHNKTGIACDYVDSKMRTARKTIAKTVIAQQIKQELIEEEMRVFYVALTRAKEKLILTGGIRNVENSRFKWSMVSSFPTLPDYYVRKSQCYLDWVGGTILKPRDVYAQSDDFITEGEAYRDKDEFVSKDFSWEIHFIDDIHNYRSGNIFSPAAFKEKEQNEEKEKAQTYVAAKLSYVYPYKRFADVASSISISEIKRNYQQQMLEMKEESINEYKMPEFTMETIGLNAAQKGTAMHAVMEHVDFRKKYTLPELKAFVCHLADISVLTKEEADAVNCYKILSFLNSDMGVRIRKANSIKKEVPFAMEISAFEAYGKEEFKGCPDSVLVRGIADCYFTEGDKAVLIDYKTDFVPEGEEETFFDKYKIQLDIYAQAIERSTGMKVAEKYIYSFFKEDFIKL